MYLFIKADVFYKKKLCGIKNDLHQSLNTINLKMAGGQSYSDSEWPWDVSTCMHRSRFLYFLNLFIYSNF